MTESSKNKVFVITIIFFLAIGLFLYFVRTILTPFLVAAFITYLISPLVIAIQSYGYRKWVAVTIIASTLTIILIIILIIFIPLIINEVGKFKISIYDYYEYILNYMSIVKGKIELNVPILKRYDVSNVIITEFRDFVFSMTQQIPNYLINIFSIFSIIILVPLLALFMLLGGNKGINLAISFFPAEYIETILSIIYEIDAVFGRFIRGRLVETSFVCIMYTIFLRIIGVNFALIIGIVAGIANIIPYSGPSVGLILAIIVGVIQFKTFIIIVKIIAVYAIIQFLDNNLVQPFVICRNVNLGPVMMVFATLAGGKIFGLLGVVFAVPVTAILKTVFVMLIQKYKRAVV
jgi:predicted PurR-regulated permease PerM